MTMRVGDVYVSPRGAKYTVLRAHPADPRKVIVLTPGGSEDGAYAPLMVPGNGWTVAEQGTGPELRIGPAPSPWDDLAASSPSTIAAVMGAPPPPSAEQAKPETHEHGGRTDHGCRQLIDGRCYCSCCVPDTAPG